MSSAEPVPEVRDVAPLGLFELPGCPACRHVAAVSEAYLAWLAVDGDQDANVRDQLSAPPRMCATHAGSLLAHSGGSARLICMYRRFIEVAAANIAERPAACPVCEHAAGAADQMFGYVLGEATRGDRRTYKQHGGLCLPHLRGAAVARRGADILWLVRFMIVRLTAESPSLDVLAGHASGAGPTAGPALAGQDQQVCVVCAAGAEAARSERDGPAQECLCPQHLRDVVMSAGHGAADVLAEQAALHAARLGRVIDGRARSLGNFLSVRARRALADPDCPVCRSSDAACMQAITDVASALRQPGSASPAQLALCVRHVRAVQAVDQHAGRIAQAHLGDQGQQVLAQLAAVDDDVAGHLTRSGVSAVTALRHAAAFLDGSDTW